MNDLYKGQDNPNGLGNGTTMDAVRNELLTGEPTFGKFHTQKKLNDYMNGLNKLLRGETLSSSDTTIVEALIKDILDALGGN